MLKGRDILITGSTGGIGFATAEIFALNGANLMLVAHDLQKLEDQKNYLKKYNITVEIYCVDIASESEVKRLYGKLFKIRKKLDSIVNNAGVLHSKMFGMISSNELNEVFQTNTLSSFYMLQYGVRFLKKSDVASVVNIGSVMAEQGSLGHTLYSASKSALLGLSRSLAKELAPEIRVNLVAPGVVETKLIASMQKEQREAIVKNTPLNRVAKPEEVAKAILFLVSDMSSFVTGEVLHVDGGLCSI